MKAENKRLGEANAIYRAWKASALSVIASGPGEECRYTHH